MKILYTNNAASTLDAGIDDTVLTLDVSAGDGSLFPSPANGTECFFVTLSNATSMEIVKVTDRTTDTFTIVRAQEGTVASSFNAGDKVELLITAGIMEDLRDNSLRIDGAIPPDTIIGLNADRLDNAEAADFFLVSEDIRPSSTKVIDFGAEFKEDIKLYTNYSGTIDTNWDNVVLFIPGQGVPR